MTSSPSTKLVRLNRGQSFDFTCSYGSSLVDVIQFIMYKDNVGRLDDNCLFFSVVFICNEINLSDSCQWLVES